MGIGRGFIGFVLVAAIGCGGDDGDGAADSGGQAGDGNDNNAGDGRDDDDDDNAEESGEAPPPGPSADGWQSAWSDDGVRISCDDTEADLQEAGAPSLSFDDATIYFGYEQVGNNQNPIVARFDGGTAVWCQIHETEGPDGRALGLTWDGGEFAYVVYTIVGGGSSLEGKGGWLSSYAPGSISGGGPKVSVLGRVTTGDGALDTATFVIAVKSDNKVNSHSPRGPATVLPDGNVEFIGGSAHKPIDADRSSSMDCTDYPFDSRYHFTADLTDLVCAECTNCTAQMPCGG